LKFARVGVRLAKEEHFDLILSPSENIEMCLPAFLTSRETKIPWVAIVHHLDFSKQLFINNLQCGPFRKFAINFYTMPRNIDKKLIYFLYNTASIISVSQATKEAIRHVGVTSSVFICGNGINTNQIGQTQSMKVIYDGIFVGRFVQSKGLMEALKVFEKILARDSEARFALVGGGDPTIVSMIKEEIERKNLEKNVEIFGYVEEKKKFELLKSSKIFIYPSHVEGWGIVVGEALACGLPVICYDLPAFKEVFNCEAVRMCKEGNVDLMVAETIRLLQNETERKRLGLIGQNFVRKYDWDEIAKREAQIYKLINSHQQQEYNPNGGALGK
jgi:glycosyltransferase involved in cell wall biosynthesis